MDALLLLAPAAGSIGYAGRGDFAMAPDGRLHTPRRARGGALRLCRRGDPVARAVRRTRRRANSRSPLLFDRAADAGRLHGLRLEGLWMHVGTPDAIALAEAAIRGQHGLNGRARKRV